MTREMFLRVAAAALRQRGVPDPEGAAEVIATRMDVVAEALGDAPATAPPPREPTRTSFPSPNPDAVAPVPAFEPAAATTTSSAMGHAGPPLVTLETSIPDRAKIVRAADLDARMAAPAAPVRSIRQPAAGRLKVEELSALIQGRTPPQLTFAVPSDDESQARMVTYFRNVISRHAYDSVQLVYAPPNATASAREATEVMASIHIDDPLDMEPILKALTEQAIQTLRPRSIPMSVTPPMTRGPVQPTSDYPDGSPSHAAQADLGQAGAIFKSVG